jgi:hypothetical protein
MAEIRRCALESCFGNDVQRLEPGAHRTCCRISRELARPRRSTAREKKDARQEDLTGVANIRSPVWTTIGSFWGTLSCALMKDA